jgi:hypothetical protein
MRSTAALAHLVDPVTHQQIQRRVMLLKKVRSNMRANVSRSPGKKNSHRESELSSP